MKHHKYKILLTVAFAAISSGIYAQNDWDAYTLSQQYNEGSARSVAMGNAMTALGGDMGAIPINPAASAVYRYSEFIFTPSLTIGSNSTEYLGNSINDSKTRFGIANFGYVASFNTGRRSHGLINWNLGIVFNKLNNYTDRMSASGRNSESSWLQPVAAGLSGLHATRLDLNDYQNPFYDYPWKEVLAWNTSALDTLPDSGSDYYAATENLDHLNGTISLAGDLMQDYYRESIGNVSQIDINFGGNISNKFYFGVNIGILSVWHKYFEYYSETAVNPAQFNSGFRKFSYEYLKKTSGTGVNMRIGMIYNPVAGLRIGASISTPTIMFLHESYQQGMTTYFSDGQSPRLYSPVGEYDYQLTTPFRWNVGVAYVFGGAASLSVDYERVNYSQMKLEDSEYHDVFADTNSDIKNYYKSQNIVRAGGEFNCSRNFAVRAGFQYYNSGRRYDSTNLYVGSLGAGYVSDCGLFVDIAYQQRLNRTTESFALYDDIYSGNTLIAAAPVGYNKSNNWKLLFSIGFRF